MVCVHQIALTFVVNLILPSEDYQRVVKTCMFIILTGESPIKC